MNETLSLKKTAKKEVIFNSIDEVIVDIFGDSKSTIKKPLKLLSTHKKYLNNICFKDRISKELNEKYPSIIIEQDPELKLVLEFVINIYNASNNEAKNSVINFFCDVIGELLFLNPTKHDSNVFRSILSSVSDNDNSLPYLVNELKKRFDKRIEGLKNSQSKAISESESANNADNNFKKSMTVGQLKNQKYNVLAIAILWSVSVGKTTQAKAIDNLFKIIMPEGDESVSGLSIESFLASNLNSASKKELGALIEFFINNQNVASDEKLKSQMQALDYKNQLESALVKNKELNSLLTNRNDELEDLNLQLLKLHEAIESKEQFDKAERVHLKDDTGKVKSKAINLLEEMVIPPLRTSLKALDRDEPKVKIAIHNIDVIIEEVEGALQWFKK